MFKLLLQTLIGALGALKLVELRVDLLRQLIALAFGFLETRLGRLDLGPLGIKLHNRRLDLVLQVDHFLC